MRSSDGQLFGRGFARKPRPNQCWCRSRLHPVWPDFHQYGVTGMHLRQLPNSMGGSHIRTVFSMTMMIPLARGTVRVRSFHVGTCCFIRRHTPGTFTVQHGTWLYLYWVFSYGASTNASPIFHEQVIKPGQNVF